MHIHKNLQGVTIADQLLLDNESTEVEKIETYVDFKKFAYSNTTNVIFQAPGDVIIGESYIEGVTITGQTEINVYVDQNVTRYLGKLPIGFGNITEQQINLKSFGDMFFMPMDEEH
jgi:heme oxygenase